MSRDEVVKKIVATKVSKALKWSDVAIKLGLSKEWATAACLGQMTLTAEQARVVDFKMDLTREPDPKGDRVKIVMSGKFLPYKTY